MVLVYKNFSSLQCITLQILLFVTSNLKTIAKSEHENQTIGLPKLDFFVLFHTKSTFYNRLQRFSSHNKPRLRIHKMHLLFVISNTISLKLHPDLIGSICTRSSSSHQIQVAKFYELYISSLSFKKHHFF